MTETLPVPVVSHQELVPVRAYRQRVWLRARRKADGGNDRVVWRVHEVCLYDRDLVGPVVGHVDELAVGTDGHCVGVSPCPEVDCLVQGVCRQVDHRQLAGRPEGDVGLPVERQVGGRGYGDRRGRQGDAVLQVADVAGLCRVEPEARRRRSGDGQRAAVVGESERPGGKAGRETGDRPCCDRDVGD